MTSPIDNFGHSLEQTKAYVEEHSWQAAAAVDAWGQKEGSKLAKETGVDKVLSYLKPLGDKLTIQPKDSTATKIGIMGVEAAAQLPTMVLAAAAASGGGEAKGAAPHEAQTPKPVAPHGHSSDSAPSPPKAVDDNTVPINR